MGVLYTMALAETVVDVLTSAKEQHGGLPLAIKLQSNEIKALMAWSDHVLGPLFKTDGDGTMRVLGVEVIQVLVAPLDRLVWELDEA